MKKSQLVNIIKEEFKKVIEQMEAPDPSDQDRFRDDPFADAIGISGDRGYTIKLTLEGDRPNATWVAESNPGEVYGNQKASSKYNEGPRKAIDNLIAMVGFK